MERVVITGIGMVIPNGIGVLEPWRRLLAAESAIGPITQFDTTDYQVKVAGEVRGFVPEQFIDKRKIRELDRFAMLSLAATKLAFEDGALELTEEERDTTGTIIGVGLGGLHTLESCHEVVRTKGPKRLTPYFIPSDIANMAAGQARSSTASADRTSAPRAPAPRARTPSARPPAGSVVALADVMIAGGAEATITHARRRRLLRDDGAVQAQRSDGLAPLGQGPRRLRHRRGRGHVGARVAHPRQEARRADLRRAHRLRRLERRAPHHPARPRGRGRAAGDAPRARDAKLDPSAVGYINAHGTSTPQGDLQEATAIRHVFGDARDLGSSPSRRPSRRWAICLGGAGAVEAAICALAIHEGVIPPTLHLTDPDTGVEGLDLVPLQPREKKVRHALSNSFGFGGTNAALLLSAYEG